MTTIKPPLDAELIARHNASRIAALRDDYGALSRALERRGLAIDAIKSRAAALELAMPSWGTGTGGTRFARFPCLASRRTLMRNSRIARSFMSCAASRRASRRIFHGIKSAIPRRCASARSNWASDSTPSNSNTFQDQADQAQSYRYGSLTHTSPRCAPRLCSTISNAYSSARPWVRRR